MRMLFVTRLFSGLESSCNNESWKPTGVPAIYKMMEKFDSDATSVDFILTQKDGATIWRNTWIKKIKFPQLKNNFTILPSEFFLSRFFPRKLNFIIRELFHLFYILSKAIFRSYDVVYIDHANTYTASFLARFSSLPVVYRVMGVYPYMKRVLKGNSSLSMCFMRWCYRSPFTLVVCTQDGSGIENWLQLALHRKVPKLALINGVDASSNNIDFIHNQKMLPFSKDENFILLFVGKLEQAKGILEFLMITETLLKKLPQFRAVLVGTGAEKNKMLVMMQEYIQEGRFIYFDRLSHDKISQLHHEVSAYISLNKLGSLSNANLEAYKYGQCVLIPLSQNKNDVDKFTDEFVPSECVVRFGECDDIEAAIKQLMVLNKDSMKVEQLKIKMKKWANTHIISWQERVDLEWKSIDQAINFATSQV